MERYHGDNRSSSPGKQQQQAHDCCCDHKCLSQVLRYDSHQSCMHESTQSWLLHSHLITMALEATIKTSIVVFHKASERSCVSSIHTRYIWLSSQYYYSHCGPCNTWHSSLPQSFRTMLRQLDTYKVYMAEQPILLFGL